MVGTMQNLVNEVLQAAVGNHFRNTLQGLEAVRFIETRAEVQASALLAITTYLSAYDVETRGVYIQDVDFPEELVTVLTKREIANQEKATYAEQQRSEIVRIEMEKARGTADMQAQLAQSAVGIEIQNNEASAREAQARGEAAYVEMTGRAEAAKTEAIGLARAAGYREQTDALGQTATALVAVANAVAEGNITVVPEVLVAGGGGAIEGLAAALMRTLGTNGNVSTNGTKPVDDTKAETPKAVEGAAPVEAVEVPAS
jgi:regulator of protease activity HflC (stomatin/prohibitin superfamily)